jgi:7,8-dihydropterin-6-yl-methyl-4-(beta-D-ribofuranosyl)aminobenzene 5'-phosphate synthase
MHCIGEIEPIALQPVDRLAITTLVDNVTDTLLADEGPARRARLRSGPRVPAPVLDVGEAFDALRAEHGFAALVSFTRGNREHRVLFDTGISPDGLTENMRRLGLPLEAVEAIVLSHGHYDHVGGMDGVVRELGTANLPVFLHPEAWSRRRITFPGGDSVRIAAPSRRALEDAGFEILERRESSFLFDGALLVTGEVDRTTSFEQGLGPSHQAYREGEWRHDQLVLDDQALVAKVRGRGLVVLTGCGHAGIINTLRYVTKLTGCGRLHAVLGGFHLSGGRFEPLIAPTCDAFSEFAPDFLVPAHCTGWKATHALAARFPDSFLPNAVGTRFEFEGVDEGSPPGT